MKKCFSIAVFSFLLLVACSDKKNIVSPGDYAVFLKGDLISKEEKTISEELFFWQQRLKKDTGNFVDMLKLASAHLHLFKLKGEISDLNAGDSLLKASNAKLNNSEPEILFSLAQSSITQHKFRDAALYTKMGQQAMGDLYTARLLAFDADMELGLFQAAAKTLASLNDQASFDYLIRKAKLEDHKGNLDEAIRWMQAALEKVRNRDRGLYCWALANLGDMYGHAGRIQEAYDAYLGVLQKDGSYLYALKGIAWIAYSHDHDIAEAKRILHYIQSQTKMPALWLTLAEMEEWEGNHGKQREYIASFLDEVKKLEYGDMYNQYLIEIYLEDLKQTDRALAIAEKEVQNRPAPEAFDWLAWSLYKKGELTKAFAFSKNNVYRQTFEPGAVLHTALIYAAIGKKKQAKAMLQDCLVSSFELGPVQARQIKNHLKSL